MAIEALWLAGMQYTLFIKILRSNSYTLTLRLIYLTLIYLMSLSETILFIVIVILIGRSNTTQSTHLKNIYRITFTPIIVKLR